MQDTHQAVRSVGEIFGGTLGSSWNGPDGDSDK